MGGLDGLRYIRTGHTCWSCLAHFLCICVSWPAWKLADQFITMPTVGNWAVTYVPYPTHVYRTLYIGRHEDFFPDLHMTMTSIITDDDVWCAHFPSTDFILIPSLHILHTLILSQPFTWPSMVGAYPLPFSSSPMRRFGCMQQCCTVAKLGWWYVMRLVVKY